MIEVICSKCEKEFEYNESLNGNSLSRALSDCDEYTCYSCALSNLTGGRAPEEGDFNRARLISGEISKKELKWLMEDLRAVELGYSIREYDDTDLEQAEYFENSEHCTECGLVVYDERFCPYCNPEDASDFREEE